MSVSGLGAGLAAAGAFDGAAVAGVGAAAGGAGSNFGTGILSGVSAGGGLGSGFNTLVDSSGSPATYLDNYFTQVPVGTYSGLPNNFKLLPTLNVAMALASLQAAGVSSLTSLPAASVTTRPDGSYSVNLLKGATFTPETAAVATSLVTKLVTDSNRKHVFGATPGIDIAAALSYNIPSGHNVIVLGVGPSVSAIGKTVAQAPMFIRDIASLNPAITYGRFLLAVDVDVTNGTAAKMLGVVHAQDALEGWQALTSNIEGYYTQ